MRDGPCDGFRGSGGFAMRMPGLVSVLPIMILSLRRARSDVISSV